MNLKYKILEVVSERRQVVVQYYTDNLTAEELDGTTRIALTLPVPTPTGDALKRFIVNYAPIKYLEMCETAKADPSSTDTSMLSNEVGMEQTAVVPEPLTLEQMRQGRLDGLELEYEHCVTSGFISAALGSDHKYKSDRLSQIWLVGAVMAQQDRMYECTNLATNVTARVLHTALQLQQVLRDGALLAEQYKDEYHLLKSQLEAATTIEELQAVPFMVPKV
jgi:hypothetical protein